MHQFRLTTTHGSSHRWKRYLSEETLERNRERSKQYYAKNRTKVLAKLKTNYAQKRQAQTQAHCEKYRGFLASYFKIDPIVSVPRRAPTQDVLNAAPPKPTNPLDLSFILN
ncbi:hypothetical protein ACHHYP_05721 [Achlya hypogyna]|uniref:Uncharacterized protein n=1 Tax=Achlya hypogyna TaxID=1202772 RepID=A0A1V9YWV6_ACHHY|nr:hypothetical protein ACHHYP_05721 [Achlya hypogyna]